VDALLGVLSAGSSPRVWGTYCRHPMTAFDKRFIPTCVGNMAAMEPVTMNPSVHPHVCGEHVGTLVVAMVGHGSSPRVWGT